MQSTCNEPTMFGMHQQPAGPHGRPHMCCQLTHIWIPAHPKLVRVTTEMKTWMSSQNEGNRSSMTSVSIVSSATEPPSWQSKVNGLQTAMPDLNTAPRGNYLASHHKQSNQNPQVTNVVLWAIKKRTPHPLLKLRHVIFRQGPSLTAFKMERTLKICTLNIQNVKGNNIIYLIQSLWCK